MFAIFTYNQRLPTCNMCVYCMPFLTRSLRYVFLSEINFKNYSENARTKLSLTNFKTEIYILKRGHAVFMLTKFKISNINSTKI